MAVKYCEGSLQLQMFTTHKRHIDTIDTRKANHFITSDQIDLTFSSVCLSFYPAAPVAEKKACRYRIWPLAIEFQSATERLLKSFREVWAYRRESIGTEVKAWADEAE